MKQPAISESSAPKRRRQFGERSTYILKNPGGFALCVLKAFRKNQGLLLAGAVAYYTLLSLIPLLILMLIALSHVIEPSRLLATMTEYLDFIVPGQSGALVGELRAFLEHGQAIGAVLLLTMVFFSALAFTVLENAMSVIFYHRVTVRRRRFVVSALLPYIFIFFLGLGLHLDRDLSGHAGGAIVAAPRADRRSHRGIVVGGHATLAGVVLRHHVAGTRGLRLADDGDPGAAFGGDRRHTPAARRAGHRRI